MKGPIVSCIMPTANRLLFVEKSISLFLKQSYKNKELIILDDSVESIYSSVPKAENIKYFYSETPFSTGAKRNFACELASGELILHWDDDDYYSKDWISNSLKSILDFRCDLSGLDNVNFYSTLKNELSFFKKNIGDDPWVYGGTFIYWKAFWDKHKFSDMIAGEDNEFIRRSKPNVRSHNSNIQYLSILHKDNVGMSSGFENPVHKLEKEKWKGRLIKPFSSRLSTIPRHHNNPLASCIMPTADRPEFIRSAIDLFLQQDYPNKELIIIDDGIQSVRSLVPDNKQIRYYYINSIGKLGCKRNLACDLANGDFIVHLDDDDWYSPQWISYQVHVLIDSSVDISGLDKIQFFAPTLNKYWIIKNYNSKLPWLSGATIAYTKRFWKEHKFENLSISEDDTFIRNSGAKILAHTFFEGFIATLHPKSVTKTFNDPWFHSE
jgi:glycosyltransferase involved in cell wall biosynthesis